jgi:hypothetical protein
MNDINGTPLGMVLSASTAMSVSGNYANSGISHADTHTVDSTGFGGGVLFLTNNTGVGSGSFTVPSAAASTAVLLSLSDIALPGVQPIAIGTGGGGTGTGTGTGTGIGTGTVTTDATTNSLGNATNTTNTVVSNDPGPNNAQDETRSPSDVADLGRGSAANGRDPFTGDFRLVSSSGDLGGQPYFTANLFDFAANKSSQPNRDEERR